MILLHYLGLERFDRQEIFATQAKFDRFLRLDLKGSELLFQRHVARITDSTYLFER